MLRLPVFAALVLACMAAVGCKPKIGDSCNGSVDCSVQGDRICDTASPGGYCTIEGCDPDTCPNDALCVEWRYEPDRTSETWCMETCNGEGGCDRKNYHCLRPGDFFVQAEARITDLDPGRAQKGFCAYVDPAAWAEYEASLGASLMSPDGGSAEAD